VIFQSYKYRYRP